MSIQDYFSEMQAFDIKMFGESGGFKAMAEVTALQVENERLKRLIKAMKDEAEQRRARHNFFSSDPFWRGRRTEAEHFRDRLSELG